MAEKVVNRNLVTLGPGILREIGRNRIRDTKSAVGLQFEDGRGGKLLGQRSESKSRRRRVYEAGLTVCETVTFGEERPSVHAHRNGA